MSLISSLQAKDKKGLFKSNDDFISYSTGLAPLDFANGFIAPLGNDRSVATIGVMGGRSPPSSATLVLVRPPWPIRSRITSSSRLKMV